MNDIKLIVKKRFYVFVVCFFVMVSILIGYCNVRLMPTIVKYGGYECNNIMNRLVNEVVAENITEYIKEEILVNSDEEGKLFEFNTSVLNSISSMTIRKLQNYLYKLKSGDMDEEFLRKIGIDVNSSQLKKGIIYEVPFYKIFNNILLNGMSLKIPVRYNIIGEIKGQLVSNLKEYGINNALLEINLEIFSKSVVSVPILSEEQEFKISIPIFIKNIEGEIPDNFFGSNIIGG